MFFDCKSDTLQVLQINTIYALASMGFTVYEPSQMICVLKLFFCIKK